MGLIRLITFALLIWILWFMYKNYITKQKRSNQRKRVDSRKIVKCRYCDLHLPEDQAVAYESDWFCSPAHRQAFLEK